MILAFKVILIAILIISFMGAMVDDKPDNRSRMTGLAISSMVAVFAAFMWL